MEEKILCSVCGARLTDETVNEFEGQIFCGSCFNEAVTVCDCCGRQIWRDDARGNDSITLCDSCYDYNYTHCEECGRLIHNDEAFYDDESDYPYCRSCFDRLQENAIKSYNYKPEPTFYGSGNLFYGIELEIDKGGEYDKNAEVLLSIANANSDVLYAKHDGSIDNGFELVSEPASLDYHLNSFKWSNILEKAVEMGYRSHNTSTCGLHIHVSRSAFGKTSEEQDDVISRIVYFVEAHCNELLKFSRRTESNIMRWASRYGIDNSAKLTYDKAKKNLGRYAAVNLLNFNTIEFRIFRGTLRYKTFIAALQLVDEVCRLAIMLDDKSFESMSWSDFALRISRENKPELIEYLKSKRLYVNDLTTEAEEM